ncbi:amino acid ABC transporter ATP-binding protein [Celerinatantimonas diazotrophica]|uniref:Amino acid ABC transporter ATP-binding protein (PAAT family) n=1 Tax=Celerinatantimonas diazotrophica TaxID=412034 RepID=A0A4R1J8R3_9GAMM|nr:amino acid ABC transporter ATP-binding protein [Celerinatantimonas diazotrophica]TCK46757.1 amino acid ABC transporter ATP-binding protein (PAAT family) [Celerinatantimonas diazotrophica]CAG9295460.1 Glutamine transport ATP-binding protein GlnQ [Celerinatantimonas diazotrophica]
MSLISIEQVHKYYSDNHVLKGVDLKIDAGEVISIIGRSGSGKSTLLRCINGLEQFSQGAIIIDKKAVDNDEKHLLELSRSVGMIFQNFNLFPHLTVAENIMLAPKLVLKLSTSKAKELAQQVLGKVGLSDKAEQFPGNLSGGQQQRVAIARALAMQPKALLCDEITSALDPELVGEVLKVLEQLKREGMTLILVTHEMNFARDVGDRVVFMHHGKVWETGPAKEVFNKPQTPELQSFLAAVL